MKMISWSNVPAALILFYAASVWAHLYGKRIRKQFVKMVYYLIKLLALLESYQIYILTLQKFPIVI